MAVRIQINENSIQAKIDNIWESGLEMLSSQILKDCNMYCKEDTGMLIASSLVHSRPQEGKLIWQTPYARRQYWEIRAANQTPNPNATWRWCEYAKQRRLAQWRTQAERLTRGNL
jgi:hypothetical protein